MALNYNLTRVVPCVHVRKHFCPQGFLYGEECLFWCSCRYVSERKSENFPYPFSLKSMVNDDGFKEEFIGFPLRCNGNKSLNLRNFTRGNVRDFTDL